LRLDATIDVAGHAIKASGLSSRRKKSLKSVKPTDKPDSVR
jgi:hypothetical protein